MKNNSLEITLVSVDTQIHNIARAAQLSSIHPDIIEEFVRAKLVTCVGVDGDERPLFDESGICRLRLLSDLRERERLSLRMMRVVCHLMDRLERAEAKVRLLKNRRG